jgi:hypothetical protein
MKAAPTSYPRSQEIMPPGTVFYTDNEILGAGRIAKDHSGRGNHITYVSNINKSKAYGTCPYLGGTAYGTIPNNNMDVPTPPLAMFAWVKLSSAATSNAGIIFKTNTGAAFRQYGMTLDYVNKRLMYYLNHNSYTTANNTINFDVWTMVGGVWDGSKLQLYINGLTSGSPSSYSSATLTSEPLVFIGERSASDSIFKGNLGEMWVIRNNMKPADVLNLFRDTAWKYGVKS